MPTYRTRLERLEAQANAQLPQEADCLDKFSRYPGLREALEKLAAERGIVREHNAKEVTGKPAGGAELDAGELGKALWDLAVRAARCPEHKGGDHANLPD